MSEINDRIEKLDKYFNYGRRDFTTPIPENLIEIIDTKVLDVFGFSRNTFTQFNAFFVLLHEYYYLIKKKLNKKAAYVCYLMSYYLFMPLHPPASWELCKIYADKAVELDKDNVEYVEWKELVYKGN